MDQHPSLTEIIATLSKILTTPTLLTAQPKSISESKSRPPILPRDIPNFNPLKLELTSLALNFEDRDSDTLAALSRHLTTDILPHLNLASLSPNYYGFVTGGATPAALLGDFLTSIYDQNVQVHLPRETIATTLEVATLNLLVQLFRLPEAEWLIGGSGPGGGTFTTGATASNVLGLALGREYALRKALERKSKMNGTALSCGEWGIAEMMMKAGVRKIQILSTLPHSGTAKAASLVGIGRRNIISISADHDPLQIDLGRLEQEARKEHVLSILAISTGEVNTGRFATNSSALMSRLRSICDELGIWIHVDGAFGLFGRIFSPDDLEYREIVQGVQGLELADSITGDCHKLLNVPYDSGVFFTRHKGLSEDVFRNGNAAYLTGAMGDGDVIQSPLHIGIENSRRFRALPVYSTLRAYGRDGYLDMLRRQVRLARRVSKWLLKDDRFEVLPGGADTDEVLAKTFIVVLFRVRDEEVSKDFVKNVNATGRIYISGTVWDGKPAARIAVSNWQVDVERDGGLIEDVLNQITGGRS
ncbi:uncharacterized protein Z518_03953 [Rhinocladiella mackenziei CBS 650.93]|uniref:Tyrosine decarboxylase n=1 Tax=Rhinocladiella mackenziei CBS 650.93 TaxID=1442369 RepID=A0A0D2IJV6_9EURO|nr:uncharacterized protein Z518_03953 [Rhinocladiella mackenziei CBS 650.93]KIX05979.1 hypothetical protein Z518_03953 [Rhinocladiella mackenziei CBS 650.93]